MPPRDRIHILVPSQAAAERFSPSPGRDGPSPPSPANRSGHGTTLKGELERALATSVEGRAAQGDRIEGTIEGVYVEFESIPGFELALTSLERGIAAGEDLVDRVIPPAKRPAHTSKGSFAISDLPGSLDHLPCRLGDPCSHGGFRL